MIEHFLESTLVIDDQTNEAKPLMSELEKQDIWVRHFKPDELLNRNTPLKKRKLIFLDLYLDEKNTTIAGNISLIRKIFETAIGKDYGSYGLIVWTKHPEDVEELKTRMAKDRAEYCLPLFILPLAKTKYMTEGYDNLNNDLNELLKSHVASHFFVYWDMLVNKSNDHSIQSIYSLASESYKTIENDLKFILYKMAHNQTGIPLANFPGYRLEDDAIQAIADLLNFDIVHHHNAEINLFDGKIQSNFSGDKALLYANLNSKLLLNFKGLDQNAVIPGNVYKIIDGKNAYVIDGCPEDATKIIVEITPPCDLAQDKKGKLSRILAGFFMSKAEALSAYNKPVFYNFIKGVLIEGKGDPQYFIFDFRYSGSVLETDLQDQTKYELLFRFKDKLFADILQKSSSHTARLGIPFIS